MIFCFTPFISPNKHIFAVLRLKIFCFIFLIPPNKSIVRPSRLRGLMTMQQQPKAAMPQNVVPKFKQ
jgi:hypothetical protein